MANKRPVVVYGANGFSGRLVVEYLREYNFVLEQILTGTFADGLGAVKTDTRRIDFDPERLAALPL